MMDKIEKIKSNNKASVNDIEGPRVNRDKSHCLMPATLAQLTLDAMDDAVLSTDINGRVNYLNHTASRLTGWHISEALGCAVADVLPLKRTSVDETLKLFFGPALQNNQDMKAIKNYILARKDGGETSIEGSSKPILNELGADTGTVMVFRDVTQAKEMNLKMAHLAEHDILTGLPNRLLLQERLNQALALAKRHEKLLAILYVDIDLFKDINDVHGHAVGDKLLCSIAKRMVQLVRESDTVCRHGGDEFVVLLSEIEHCDDAAKFSTKLLTSLARPILIDGKEINVNMSIGISIFPKHGDLSDGLIDYADKAMFKAKANGRNCYQ
jgi:diguanylate cyclase (GGDEF)-like protein/PAS domain S-box-containing protein